MESEIRDKKIVKQVPICLSPVMIEDMDKLADQRGMIRGRSVIARLAISEYLRRNATEMQQTLESA